MSNFKIRNDAYLFLMENYENSENSCTFRDFVEMESESDPSFFRWLFDEVGNEKLSDFENPDPQQFEDFLDDFCVDAM